MSDGTFFIRIIKGEEPLSTTFWTTLLIMLGDYAYTYFAPSYSDFYDPYFKAFHLLVITYAVVSVHNACANAGVTARLFARSYVLALVGFATFIAYYFYGPAGYFYPLAALLAVFLVR